MKSKNWLLRQRKDLFSKEAKLQGFLSRAAFKLIEIDKKFNFISNSKNIIEFGASPGGWSQVIIQKNPKAKITAFDVIEMSYSHENIHFHKKNFLEFDFNTSGCKYDLVLSDIAPNTTGHKQTDHLRIVMLLENIISLTEAISKSGSNLVIKIWKGHDEKNIFFQLKKIYKKVSYFKPKSSRNESSEIFLIGQDYIF